MFCVISSTAVLFFCWDSGSLYITINLKRFKLPWFHQVWYPLFRLPRDFRAHWLHYMTCFYPCCRSQKCKVVFGEINVSHTCVFNVFVCKTFISWQSPYWVMKTFFNARWCSQWALKPRGSLHKGYQIGSRDGTKVI